MRWESIVTNNSYFNWFKSGINSINRKWIFNYNYRKKSEIYKDNPSYFQTTNVTNSLTSKYSNENAISNNENLNTISTTIINKKYKII
jgi:hypothetical protein